MGQRAKFQTESDAPRGDVPSFPTTHQGVGMKTIPWCDFETVESRAGTIVEAEDFPKHENQPTN